LLCVEKQRADAEDIFLQKAGGVHGDRLLVAEQRRTLSIGALQIFAHLDSESSGVEEGVLRLGTEDHVA